MVRIPPPRITLVSGKARGWFLFGLGLVVGLTVVAGGSVFAGRDTQGSVLPWDEVRLFAEVLERVRQEYVEPVDDQRLLENAVRGMVAGLDPHSQFLDAAAFEEIRIGTSGNYSGVGLEVNTRDGRVLVVSPIEGTPADKAGIRSGDIILRIDEMVVSTDNIVAAISRLRGPPGSQVRLTVSRSGEPAPLVFELIRSNVQFHSVRTRLLEPGLGYVRISQFSETTDADFRQALADLTSTPRGVRLRGLVLDLRNNPGGVLDAAVAVSDDLLDSGVIVTASGRGRDARFRHEARAGELLQGSSIVVLVNGGSASAAEIVAAALRDNQRATLVGSRTFGKGSVQTVIPLSDGRALKLTTSRYFTPSGASINGQGITPDVVLENTAAPAQPPAADPALERALELLKQGAVVEPQPPAASPGQVSQS